MARYDSLPEDLAALLDERDPSMISHLLALAGIVDRCPASLILDALGEFELLTVYICARHDGMRQAEHKRRDPRADGEVPF